MSELSFLAFCLTVIALTAMSQSKDKVAEKALSALSHTVGDFAAVLEKLMASFRSRKPSKKSENSDKHANEK